MSGEDQPTRIKVRVTTEEGEMLDEVTLHDDFAGLTQHQMAHAVRELITALFDEESE
jgi:hypothetical protein